jgi:hypothetical protein
MNETTATEGSTSPTYEQSAQAGFHLDMPQSEMRSDLSTAVYSSPQSALLAHTGRQQYDSISNPLAALHKMLPAFYKIKPIASSTNDMVATNAAIRSSAGQPLPETRSGIPADAQSKYMLQASWNPAAFRSPDPIQHQHIPTYVASSSSWKQPPVTDYDISPARDYNKNGKTSISSNMSQQNSMFTQPLRSDLEPTPLPPPAPR